MRRVTAAATAWLLSAALVTGTSAEVEEDVPRGLLVQMFGLTSADVVRIDQGGVLSRVLDSRDKREIALLGVARVAVTPDFYAHQLADIVAFKQGDAVLQIGRLGSPPRLEDVRDLALDTSDLRRLRDCRVGDCDLQLPADVIQRLRSDIDWRSGEANEQANLLIRRALVDYAARYQSTGAAPQMTYADERPTVDVAAEFRDVVGSDRLLPYFPQLRKHLFTFDNAKQTTATEFLYWSKERLGPKAVVTVTHLHIARSPGPPGVHYAAASKQIYASHYFESSLGLTFLIGVPAAASPRTYVVYVNRSRVDVFGGIFGGVTRRLVRSRARSALDGHLQALRSKLERTFAIEHRNTSGRSYERALQIARDVEGHEPCERSPVGRERNDPSRLATGVSAQRWPSDESSAVGTCGARSAADGPPGWITTQIQAKCFVSGDVKPWNIDVTTSAGGVVELRGEVESAQAKTEAVRLARDVDGVTRVEDRLRVVAPRRNRRVRRTGTPRERRMTPRTRG